MTFSQVGWLALAFGTGWLVTRLLFALLPWWRKRKEHYWQQPVFQHLRFPFSLLIGWASGMSILPQFGLSTDENAMLQKGLFIGLYLIVAWVLTRLLNVASDLTRHYLGAPETDNLEERKALTQLMYLRRIGSVLIFTVIGSLILLQFDNVRQIGVGLLTSAGVAGIIIGFAAQKSLANLLAGLQIAFTQPIRIDDVVVVEGEWGRIEEITLTYVVVNLWDQRRLVLPITYFIEKPFQNWTRTRSELTGSVYLYTDYFMPVEALREELQRILPENALWDERVAIVQVTNSTEKSIEIRVLVSARNASDAWDLRCWVRERLIAFIQQNYPEALPRLRIASDPNSP